MNKKMNLGLNYALILMLSFGLSISSAFSGVVSGKLVNLLVNESGMMEILGQRGIQGASAKKVTEYVEQSLQSISFSGKKPDAQELRKIINEIAGSSQDNQYKKELVELLDMPAEKVSKDDLVKAINSLIFLSNRFGKRGSSVLACAECVSNDLAGHGFKFTLETLNNRSSTTILKRLSKYNPKQLTNFISTEMRKGGFGDFSRAPKNLVAPEEEKALGLFLGIVKSGNNKQKALADAILEVSKDSSGKIDLLSEENPHTLWKLFSEDMNASDLDGWTTMLRQVAEEADGSEGSAKKAFFDHLEKRASDDSVLKANVEKLRKKNCFFK